MTVTALLIAVDYAIRYFGGNTELAIALKISEAVLKQMQKQGIQEIDVEDIEKLKVDPNKLNDLLKTS